MLLVKVPTAQQMLDILMGLTKGLRPPQVLACVDELL
jgi:hypothetical protein